jgi:catechol 2,3-dioxygenase-like lactoylglutathione lyase family enzyme
VKWQGLISFYSTYDLDKTSEFYEGILGLKLYKDQGKCKIFSVPGGGAIGFCSHMHITAEDKSPIITLLTSNVDYVYQQFLEKGYRVTQEPVLNKEFKIYHFFVHDPSGYCVEIQKFLD